MQINAIVTRLVQWLVHRSVTLALTYCVSVSLIELACFVNCVPMDTTEPLQRYPAISVHVILNHLLARATSVSLNCFYFLTLIQYVFLINVIINVGKYYRIFFICIFSLRYSIFIIMPLIHIYTQHWYMYSLQSAKKHNDKYILQ